MSDKKSLQDLTNNELKEILKKLSLPTTGNKAELLIRITTADPEGQFLRSHCLRRGQEDPNEAAGTIEMPRAEISDDPSISSDTARSNPQESTSSINQPYELELLRRERLLLHREIDIMRQENEILRTASPAIRDVEQSRKPPVNIKIIGELLSEYNGASQDFANWEAQLHLLKNTYELNDNLVKILIGLRLKGKALTWFHSRPELLGMTASEILRELKSMYDHRPSKVDLRKQFEARLWQSGETFHDYFHEKIVKANQVPIPQDEVLDYVIDGISDVHLRNHARMQNFTSTAELLQAFKKITIRSDFKNRSKGVNEKNEVKNKDPKSPVQEEARRKDNRCYNCNQTGHMAKSCDKPKRERGTCYECGATDHRLRNCPQKKKMAEPKASTQTEATTQISNVEERKHNDNEFLKTVELQISTNGLEYNQRCESQLDTASPISLVKSKIVPLKSVKEVVDGRYEGINGSILEILGQVEAKIFSKDFIADEVTFRVVPDHAMKCDAILGRDAIRKTGLAFVKQEEKREDVALEILNIDSNVLEGDELDKIEINPEISSTTRNRFLREFRANYLLAERPAEQKIKAEIKLHVKEKQPFYFTPGRLSYEEKGRLREIIDDLLARKIIRPGNSEYA